MKKCVSMKLVMFSLAMALSLTLASAAIAQPGEFVNGVLQPLADGFPKRPIMLIAVDDPGTRDDIYAKTLQEAMRPMSPVPITVSDEPGPTSTGTMATIKSTMNREGGMDGYYPIVTTVWGGTMVTLTNPMKKMLGVDLSDMNHVIVTESMPYSCASRKNAPWGPTWADFVKYAKANPGKVRKMCDGIGTGSDIGGDYALSHFGITVKKVPQPSAADCLAAVGSGMGDIAFQSSPSIKPHYEAGRVDVLLVLGLTVPPPWDKNPNVVSMVQAGMPKTPIGSVLGFCVPKDVPKTHIDWLFKLFKAGASTDLYKKRENSVVGLQITIMTPEEANALRDQYAAFAEPIVRSLGLHWEQTK